ncbi:FMN-binding protein [Colibacter massiliensis]|uniref:FMN-binding protein n=1 Tax=Colibacter massiliensis TaxID=1852379 RepID=UPI00094E7F4E|nr:FMN-binding protein [Colibacter massiliensis]
MKIRKYAILLFAAFAAVQLLSGCGSDDNKDEAPQEQPAQAMTVDMSKVKDGTYTAESSMDKVHGKAVITLTIADHKITAVDYKGIDKDGTTVKTSDYGKDKDPTNAKKAQVAYRAQSQYVDELLKKQDLSKVDAISGATINYNQFIEAVNKDLEQAQK